MERRISNGIAVTAHHFNRKPNLKEVKVAGHNMLRLVNRRILLSIVSDREPISRAEISKLSGMNKATVSTITAELLHEQFLREENVGKTTPSGGKPPTPLSLNEHRFGLFGLDIRADETVLALSDFRCRIVARKTFATETQARPFLTNIAREIKRLRSQHSNFIEIAGIGISLPGLVESETGRFIMSVVLPWRDVPVADLMHSSTNLSVRVDNSARCGALAEIWHSKAQYTEVRNLVYVSVSQGLACGVVIDGSLYRGGGHTAGQFGHMTMELNGPQCRCGLRGCWDLYASDAATVARFTELCGGKTRRAITMRKIVELVEAGDAAAIEALSETARYLGIGIAGLINGLDPEVVVIGGEITKAWGVIEPIIKQQLAGNLLNQHSRNIPLRPSVFEVRPSLKGALTLILNDLLSVPRVG